MNKTIAIIDKQTQVQKHTAMIHISNVLSLYARKCLNILIKNSFDSIEEINKWHTISIPELISWLNDTGNYSTTHIQKVLTELQTTLIQWNIFDKDTEVKKMKNYKSATLMPEIIWNHDEGFLKYRFSPMLIEGLFMPAKIYAKINLWIQRDFKGKHAMVIWEYLIEILCVHTKPHEQTITTNFITIDDVRALLGLKKDEYARFLDLNAHIIKKAVAEINKVSEINVEVDYRRTGRTVSHIRFQITKKPNYAEFHTRNTGKITDITGETRQITNETQPQPTIDPNKEKYKTILTQEYGIDSQIAIKWVNLRSEEDLTENIKFIKEKQKNGTINDLAGYMVNVLRNNLKFETTKTTPEILAEAKKQLEAERVRLEAEESKAISNLLQENAISPKMQDFLSLFKEVLKGYFGAMHLTWIDGLSVVDDGDEVVFAVTQQLHLDIINRNREKFNNIFSAQYQWSFDGQKPCKVVLASAYLALIKKPA